LLTVRNRSAILWKSRGWAGQEPWKSKIRQYKQPWNLCENRGFADIFRMCPWASKRISKKRTKPSNNG